MSALQRTGFHIQESHVIVNMLDGIAAAIVFSVVGHAPAMAMSRTAPRAVASFASSTGEPFHTRTSPFHTIACATVGALHDAVCDVGGRCPIAPRKPSGAHALRAIAPCPTGPAITPSQYHARRQRRTNRWPGKIRICLFDSSTRCTPGFGLCTYII